MRRNGLFYYVTSGSNVAHHVEKGSRVQSRVQLLSISSYIITQVILAF